MLEGWKEEKRLVGRRKAKPDFTKRKRGGKKQI